MKASNSISYAWSLNSTCILALLSLVLSLDSYAQNLNELKREQIELINTSYWSGLSENDTLLPEHAYLSELEFSSLGYQSDGHAVKGFMIEPKGEGTYPVIFFNRGGNRDFAALDLGTMLNYTSRIAAAGYVVMGSNYRDADEFGGEEVDDIERLMDLSVLIEKVDTSRMGMFGWSRGGMMTYLMLARTDKLKTAVIGNGVSDWRSTAIDRPGYEKKVFAQCIPDYWENKEEALSARSVIDWTDKLSMSTSILILAATNDKRADYHQAERLAEKLDETSISYELKLFDTNHYFSDIKEILHTELIQWFDKELKAPLKP